MVIDIHSHLLVPEVEEVVRKEPGFALWREKLAGSISPASLKYTLSHLDSVVPQLTQMAVRLKDMDSLGIDIQVLSPAPTQYHYWAEPELANRIVRLQNEHIAELCQRFHERICGLGAISLQHPDLAVEQLKACMNQYGLRGVEVSTSVNGRDLSDPVLDKFWEHAEGLGAVVFIHPLGSNLGPRTKDYYLANIVGQPFESTMALSHLIFGGVLDRHPRLKVCAAHGGGYLPYYAGRSDHGYRVRPECRTTERLPSEYLRRIYFDTVVHQSSVLGRLIEQVGSAQVVIGTDYPYDMGDYEIDRLLEGVPNLSEEARRDICGANAKRLLGL